MKKMNLSTITIRIMSMLAISAMFVISGCGDDDDGDPVATQNVWEIVQSRTELSNLADELEAAGLDGALASTPNITLFAPSNQALNDLLTTLGLSNFDPVRDDVAAAILTYHVATSIVLSSDLGVGSTIPTLQGEDITVVAGPALSTGATLDAEFITTDLVATNGAVHIIDYVLVPPTIGDLIVDNLGTLAQPILLAADFSILADAISQKADVYAEANDLPLLIDVLGNRANPGTDYTVFAPSNAVFVGAGIGLDDLTGEQWYGTIAKHVGVGIYEEADLTTGTEIQTAAGTTIFVTNAGSGSLTGIFLNSDGDPEFEAEVAAPAVNISSNGLIHVIAGIL